LPAAPLRGSPLHTIAVVGTGYVGLVTGACLADFGNDVTCVDEDVAKVERLSRLEIPFFEPGLPELVTRHVQEGRLHFSADLAPAVAGAKVVFLTVGTPSRADGSADTRAIFQAARQIARQIDGYKLVVQKSTAPVGTARAIWQTIKKTARR